MIKKRKRHIITDSAGNLLDVFISSARIQNREGAVFIIDRVKDLYPLISKIYADGGYAGEKFQASIEHHKDLVLQIVKRSDIPQGFVVLSKRGVVERTIAWLNRCRRLAKDWEKTKTSSTAWALISSIRRISRKIAKN